MSDRNVLFIDLNDDYISMYAIKTLIGYIPFIVCELFLTRMQLKKKKS